MVNSINVVSIGPEEREGPPARRARMALELSAWSSVFSPRASDSGPHGTRASQQVVSLGSFSSQLHRMFSFSAQTEVWLEGKCHFLFLSVLSSRWSPTRDVWRTWCLYCSQASPLSDARWQMHDLSLFESSVIFYEHLSYSTVLFSFYCCSRIQVGDL